MGATDDDDGRLAASSAVVSHIIVIHIVNIGVAPDRVKSFSRSFSQWAGLGSRCRQDLAETPQGKGEADASCVRRPTGRPRAL